jgi:hypothetical protein
VTPLAEGLQDLAASHLANLYDGVDAMTARAVEAAGAVGDPVGVTGIERAADWRARGTVAAAEAIDALDADLAAEIERVRALAVALDWLADAPPERSLAASLVGEGSTSAQRVSELVGLLGVARAEAALIDGRTPAPLDLAGAVRPLARARLGRLALRVRRWLEGLT